MKDTLRAGTVLRLRELFSLIAKPNVRRALAFSVAIAASWTLSSHDIDAQPYGATTQSGTAAAGVAPISVGAQPNTAPLALPDPIYWKQQLFLIPYKWQSAVEPSSAGSVNEVGTWFR